jgi:hypothetical protein
MTANINTKTNATEKSDVTIGEDIDLALASIFEEEAVLA